jgi:sugar transferase (PEP-CTERM/EpsH1 system associated)
MSKRSAGPNLLVLAHRLPFPPDKGDRIRTFHLIRHLALRANVHLASLADEPVPRQDLDVLQGMCARVAVVPLGRSRWVRSLCWLALGRTASEGAFFSARFRTIIEDWSRETTYHGALVSSSSLAPCLDVAGLEGVPTVIDLVDVDSQKWFDYAAACRGVRSWLYRTEGRRLRRLEQRLPGRARALTVVSETEADLFRGFCPLEEVRVVPNGVDLDYFRPQGLAGGGEGCVFVGALDYRPNVDAAYWFCKEVWPELRRRLPGVKVQLVGRRPVRQVSKLSSIPGVEVVGGVPDIRPYVARAAVALAPLRIARGVQNKVLEAMAMAKPVVASPKVLQGLPRRLDAPVLTAETPADWIEAVSRVLEDGRLRRQLAAAGRLYVERHHDWEDCLKPIGKLIGLGGEGQPVDAASRTQPRPWPEGSRV